MLGTAIKVEKLSNRKLAALRRRAKDSGLTTAAYVKQLIEDDLQLEQDARTRSLRDLAAPVHEALRQFSEDELDHLVNKARRSKGGSRSKWR